MTLPTGPAVTFLFTDIEGSTRLEREVGATAWASIVARHDALLRSAIESNGGEVVKTEGDAFFAAFASAPAGAAAAIAAQRALAGAAPWGGGDAGTSHAIDLRVRMGLHQGEGRLRHRSSEADPEDYVGIDVNYTARISAAGNGGQIVVSQAAADALAGAGNGHGPTADLGEGVELVIDGLRAVKDFDEPRRLYRLVVAGAADDTRHLRTLDPPSNLPGEVTELVGRAEQIATLRDLLASTRILTLTGPGGSGKTRLALGVAEACRDRFPHGTWFVDLAAVTDAGLLEPTLASTLGLRETSGRSPAEALREYLRERETLLLLDNLEQLLPRGAEVVATIARGAPAVRILVTSRELLRISGERGHPVPPLDQSAGVALFTARATALRPDLDLDDAARAAIREICDRLFGLPLAIELAAARVRLLSPALILQRLSTSLDLGGGARDLPERQRTLRGAIAWSHALLTEPERRLFRRLGVFAGGWTAELAMSVVDAAGDLGIDVLEGLESLADKSLVRIEAADAAQGTAAAPRFDFHPLLREYAVERMDEAGERGALESSHAEAMAVLAESLGPRILGPIGQTVIRRFDREQHNVRAAVAWALRTGNTDLGLRATAPIWRWFQQRGRVREGRALFDDLLKTPPTDVRLHIDALAAIAGLAYWGDDFEAAGVAYTERLALAEQTGDSILLADAEYDLGFISMVNGDANTLKAREAKALDLYTAAGSTNGIARARQALVLGMFLAGDYEEALELETRNLADFREAGSHYQVADSMTFHAGVFQRLGNPAKSWEYMQEGLRWFAENENQSGIARALGMAAIVLLLDGDGELGARAAGATYRVAEEKGVMIAPVRVLHFREPRDLAIERFGKERAEELMRDGAAVPAEEIIAEVLARPWQGQAPSAETPV